MAYSSSISPKPPELEKALVDHMLEGNLSQALETAVQAQNSQEILQILENVKKYYARVTLQR